MFQNTDAEERTVKQPLQPLHKRLYLQFYSSGLIDITKTVPLRPIQQAIENLRPHCLKHLRILSPSFRCFLNKNALYSRLIKSRHGRWFRHILHWQEAESHSLTGTVHKTLGQKTSRFLPVRLQAGQKPRRFPCPGPSLQKEMAFCHFVRPSLLALTMISSPATLMAISAGVSARIASPIGL